MERLDVEPASDIGVLVRVNASDVVDVRFEAKASPMSSSSCMIIRLDEYVDVDQRQKKVEYAVVRLQLEEATTYKVLA